MTGEGPFGRRSGAPAPPPDEGENRPAPRPRPPASSSATWILGIVSVVVLGYIAVNALRTEGPGSRGVPAGGTLPPFAAPLALTGPDRDAQVDPEKACAVRGPGILNLCELRRAGPVGVVFFALRSERCLDQVDVVNRAARRHPEWRFAAVAIRGERDEVARVVRERGWRIPVAIDRDGAVSNAYAVAICPTITFARRGGAVADTALGFRDDRAVAATLERIRP